MKAHDYEIADLKQRLRDRDEALSRAEKVIEAARRCLSRRKPGTSRGTAPGDYRAAIAEYDAGKEQG